LAKRLVLLTFLLVAGGLVVSAGQSTADARLQTQLKHLFPTATTFSPKGGDPPHFKAFANPQTLLGLAFWTTELDPLERAYDGPIKILVGVVVVEHHEPYGNFSIERPEFAAQFRGKNIRDAFKVGVDVDAVSRATISITSASRAIRNSSRRVARALLAPPGAAKP
jgi:transcriptional regulator of nitric oxide reductase